MKQKFAFYNNIVKFSTAIAVVFWGLACALGFLEKFEYKLYDVLLGFRKSPAEVENLLLVDIDDTALNSLGPWPWSRNVIADQLLTMRELGAETAVFDIEYLSASQKSVDEELYAEILKNPAGNSGQIKNIFKDNDDYFARSIQFFGNTWLTVNTGDLGVSYTQGELDYAKKRFLYQVENSKSIHDIRAYNRFTPACEPFISHASGAGFTNVVLDSDGSRRRIKLLQDYADGSVGQLAFAPLLKILDPERIVHRKRSIILKNARLYGTDIRKDIKIPLDSKGFMLIHWLKKDFVFTTPEGEIVPEKTSFQHNSIYYLWMLNDLEKQIVSELKAFKGDLKYAADQLLSDYQNICSYRQYLLEGCNGYTIDSTPVTPVDSAEYEQYFALRREFFQNVQALAEANTGTDENSAALYENSGTYSAYYEAMQELYGGKFCIVGNTGSSTTDLGTTPFNNSYPNVGTHANIFNTIVQQDFIVPVDWYWAVLFSGICTLFALRFCKNRKIWIQNTTGICLVLVMILIPILFMALGGIYIPVIAPVLIALTAFIITTATKYVVSEKDKAFLQTTFGAYVAPAVVDQIVKNPSIAKLGGKSDNITALFSDVKTFSRFTEVVNNEYGEDHGAEKLVATLNGYLGALSDAIMENNGTIDKYVGDEIVSFFGAPVHSDNNAYDACVAAIRMNEAEALYNKEHEAELPVNPATGKPYYLRSRIGLNTGNMVVGNMGTEKKLNYTIMGNNVNLASRLEGTNNVYGSWIMCSESTWNSANSGANEGKLVARKFDYVQVINVKKPVGIYNIIGLRDELPAARIEAAETFNKGMAWYLKGISNPEEPKDPEDLKKAIELYQKADELYPEDESSKVFIQRCKLFLENGLPEKWDGVYTMKSK